MEIDEVPIEWMKQQADHLEDYLYIIKRALCFPDRSEKELKEAYATVEELIANLRAGKAKKCYNAERLREIIDDEEAKRISRECEEDDSGLPFL